jgi:hypothetical protein
MNNKKIKTCLYCRKEFEIKKSKFNRKFCSSHCFNKYPRSQESREKISNYIKSHPIVNRPKGNKVYNYTGKSLKSCIVCNKEFLVYPSGKDKKHCSRECYYEITNRFNKVGLKNKYYLGGTIRMNRYTKIWNFMRRKALERDNFCCKLCGNKDKLVVHHSIPRRIMLLNNIENLITLCRKCHRRIESQYSKILLQHKIPMLLVEDFDDPNNLHNIYCKLMVEEK